jgi:pimeloyl-ACP methyl ester carboxylesterase
MAARDLFLAVRGLQLHALERGPADGPPVVLLHGWLDTARSFDPLAELLSARGYRTLALDLRGHGASSWAGAGAYYHLVEYLGDLDGALLALGLSQPGLVRLVGHSLGATIALLYCAARPGLLRHCALLDGLPLHIKPVEVPHRLRDWLDDLQKPRLRKTVASLEEAAGRLRKVSPLLTPEAALHLARTGTSPDPAQGGQLAWKWDPWVRGHSPQPITEELLGPLYQEITTPLYLLRAGATWLPEAHELPEQMEAIRGRLRIETLEGTSHHLHLERAGEVCERLCGAWERG